jgi:hypothetical protein
MTFTNSIFLLVGLGAGVVIYYLGLRMGLTIAQRAHDSRPLDGEGNTIADAYTGEH